VSDFDSLRADLVGAIEGMARARQAQARHDELMRRDVAALRDEVYEQVTALSNRLEALTNFVVSDPAEVAAKIVTDANRGTLREVCGDE
jgi:hypothetical protein